MLWLLLRFIVKRKIIVVEYEMLKTVEINLPFFSENCFGDIEIVTIETRNSFRFTTKKWPLIPKDKEE